ncbi:hypothetical protein [Thalassospira sp. A3_1]|uniref:hypothetical protein n=1 Tax=Thalassospira sp. A3_1 TaxID=2821088 RepID=UPI001ADD211C|nr:hypothetical protein [Thalassospira sp. A3_1]MBO9507509.1 hypothetical protein [Thalassospira sp. A3_1]
MQKAVFKARRMSHAGTLLVALIALVGCQTTDITTATSDFFSTLTNASETSGTAPATKRAASGESTAASATPENTIKKSPYKWGLLTLLVGGGGPSGDDWYLFVYPTANTQNFVGVNGPMLTIANTHSVQLWPGDYRVIVRHNTVDKFDKVVTISAGETLRLTGEYGYFSNSVESERFPFYNENQLLLATVLNRAEDIFLPVVVAWSGQWKFEFFGPQLNGEVNGPGPVRISKDGNEEARIIEAEVTPESITGTFELSDGGRFEGSFDQSEFRLDPSPIVKWKNGETFEGTFDVVVPKSGKLTRRSGSVWEGEIAKGNPTGKGRMTAPDGHWVEYDNYEMKENFIGLRPCGSVSQPDGTCPYYKGKELASEAELNAKIAEDKRLAEIERQKREEQRKAQMAAAAAAAEAQRKAAAEQAAREAAMPQKADDCTTATGTFSADGNLTTYTMNGSGSGSGHFRQFTYGGGAQYQFDIDFRFDTTPDSITFQYDEGIYRDASSGAVLQRTSIPGGSARCSFNGRILTIDGKEFVQN